MYEWANLDMRTVQYTVGVQYLHAKQAPGLAIWSQQSSGRVNLLNIHCWTHVLYSIYNIRVNLDNKQA